MAAVANACALRAAEEGLSFPPCGADDLAAILGPAFADRGEGGFVEVVSSLERDGRAVARDLRWGVYVVFEAPNRYSADCFGQYGMRTDRSGRCAALYRPCHLIGLELGISIYSAVLRGEPTGAPSAFRADAIAVAKRDLAVDERLDGEGGYTVWGKLMPACRSIESSALPIGLAKDVRLTRPVPAGEVVRMTDVELPESTAAALRQETCGMAL
jgi:predicted homoserine dehydrogenase-like protein